MREREKKENMEREDWCVNVSERQASCRETISERES